MEVLRTPDERFAALPGYPFAPHHVEVPRGDGSGALRVHYVDEGPADAPETVLMLHGEPSWSYLYRTMIPIVTAAGHRAVAPDLPGFGRSDKPAERADYTYGRHVGWMAAFLEALDLRDVTLVCQDWGGLIGLRLVAERPERFARVVAANTFLPTGDRSPGDAFLAWRKYSQEVEHFQVGRIVNGGCTTDLPPEVVAAYDAPFPNDRFKAGARQFPTLVPAAPDDPASEANRAAWKALEQWDKPFLTAFSDHDPVTTGGEGRMQRLIPGARGQAHTTISGGGHFLQEDRGPELATVVLDLIARTAR
ncbi:MAG: alpha/beta fold hydrolase [Actinobacteria bacterium]|nr:alpha/beta fold hydrolase [Actinomycetota bacterium]